MPQGLSLIFISIAVLAFRDNDPCRCPFTDNACYNYIGTAKIFKALSCVLYTDMRTPVLFSRGIGIKAYTVVRNGNYERFLSLFRRYRDRSALFLLTYSVLDCVLDNRLYA